METFEISRYREQGEDTQKWMVIGAFIQIYYIRKLIRWVLVNSKSLWSLQRYKQKQAMIGSVHETHDSDFLDTVKLLRRLWWSCGGTLGMKERKQGYKVPSKVAWWLPLMYWKKSKLLSLTMAKGMWFCYFVSPSNYDKYHGLGGLNIDIFPHCAGGWKPNVRMSAGSGSSKDSIGFRQLFSCCVFIW